MSVDLDVRTITGMSARLTEVKVAFKSVQIDTKKRNATFTTETGEEVRRSAEELCYLAEIQKGSVAYTDRSVELIQEAHAALN